MSRSCSTIAGLIANGLEDGTYIFTGGEWTRYDQAESMLSDLDAVTEVFEVPLDDPRRTSSSSGTVGSSSIHSGITSSSSSTDPSSTNSSSSSDQQQSQSQQQSQQDTSIFRGVRARCGIPAKVLITAYDGINTTSLDKINHNGASDADYFQRYLVGPDQYFRNTSVFNYGNPLGRSKGPMINDRTGTGKGFNCGLGCLLRKKGKQAQLQDVVVTTKDVPAGEELLAAYKLDAAAAQEV